MSRHYQTHKGALIGAAAAASRRYSIPFDEALSIAHLIYVRAVASHVPEVGEFKPMLNTRLRRLADDVRREAKRNAKLRRVDFNLEMIPQAIADMSDEAEAVVRYVLKQPRSLGVKKVRHRLVHHLRRTGWTIRRIRECFAEVRSAIA